MSYRKDQGRMARMAAFWTLAILIIYGSSSLKTELEVRWDALGKPIQDIHIPIIGLDLTPALLIAAIVLAASLWLLHRWQNKPKNADLLIDTEQELKKVTWPTLEESINGSLVVVICVVFLMAFLAGADYVLGEVAKVVLFGEGLTVAYRWYFVRCQSGREKRVKENALHRLKIAGVADVVPQVLVPYELVTDMKRGKKRTVEKKLYPGYLMVQADLDDPEDQRVMAARSALRGIDGLRDFLGARGEPTALSEAEVSSILARMTDSETRPQVTIGMDKGDMVKINSGPFDGFDGVVEDVNAEKGTVRVVVTIFGRPTPVDLKYWEVEAV